MNSRAVLAVVVGLTLTAQPEAARKSPVGWWTTISDDDGKPEGIVEIRQVRGEYVGIVRAILAPATHADSICGRCPGDRRGKPVVGMEILRHMKRDGDEYGDGEILDPETGKTYRAKMKLADDGRKLVVRGYIGFSLFGRSQTWIRRPRDG